MSRLLSLTLCISLTAAGLAFAQDTGDPGESMGDTGDAGDAEETYLYGDTGDTGDTAAEGDEVSDTCGSFRRRRAGDAATPPSLSNFTTADYTQGPRIDGGSFHDVHTINGHTNLLLKLRVKNGNAFPQTDTAYRNKVEYESAMAAEGMPVAPIKGYYMTTVVENGVVRQELSGHVQEKVDGTALSKLTSDQLEALGGAYDVADLVESAIEELHEVGPHGDLHAGNIVISSDGTVTFVDLGHTAGSALLSGSLEDQREAAITYEHIWGEALLQDIRDGEYPQVSVTP